MRTVLATLVLPFVLVACGRAPAPDAAAPADQADQALTEAEEQALLVRSDRADGQEDKLVSRCSVCGLAMDGDPEHSVTYRGYTFHLCSDECERTFERDPRETLARLKALQPSPDA